MKKTANSEQGWMNAITFAEAGEWDIARQMMPKGSDRHAVSWFQKTFMAAAFAEEGLHTEALLVMDNPVPMANAANDAFLRSLGLSGIRMTYGVCVA